MTGPCPKRRYANPTEARTANRRMGARLRCYFCDECGGYHITNADKAREHERSLDAEQRRRLEEP